MKSYYNEIKEDKIRLPGGLRNHHIFHIYNSEFKADIFSCFSLLLILAYY